MNSRRSFSDSRVWSNLFFLIPAGVAIYLGVYAHAAITFISLCVSIQYHLSRERRDRIIDRCSAITLMLANFWLCLAGGLELSWMGLIVGLSIAAFYFRRREHALWHLLSVCITLVSLLIYYQGL